MRAPRNRFNIYLEYIWQDSKGIGSWFAKQAEWIHCKPDWRSLAHKGYPEPETSRQEAECWFYMWIWEHTDNMPNDKLSGWTVITKMLLPVVVVALTLIYAFLKLLCCVCCSKKAVVADKKKAE